MAMSIYVTMRVMELMKTLLSLNLLHFQAKTDTKYLHLLTLIILCNNQSAYVFQFGLLITILYSGKFSKKYFRKFE